LLTHSYRAPVDIEFPDLAVPDEAAIDFRKLPGWATWTGPEAAEWIDEHVTDLSSAKRVLENMARAIMYLRDIVIER